jgi:hypothetical protein
LLVLLPLAAIVAITGSMVYQRVKQVKATSLSPGMISAVRMRLTKGLDPKSTDADKDLVADRPSDPGLLVDPNTLVFSYIATDDPKVAEATWKARTLRPTLRTRPVLGADPAATSCVFHQQADVHFSPRIGPARFPDLCLEVEAESLRHRSSERSHDAVVARCGSSTPHRPGTSTNDAD